MFEKNSILKNIKNNYLFLIVLLAFTIVFVGLALDSSLNDLLKKIFHAEGSRLGFFTFLSQHFVTFSFIGLMFYLFLNKKYKSVAISLIALIFAFESVFFLKLFFTSPIPIEVNEIVGGVRLKGSGYGFPSLNAAFLAVISVIFFLEINHLKNRFIFFLATVWFFLGLTALFARVGLEMNNFSDLPAGFLTGIAAGIITFLLEKKYNLCNLLKNHLSKKLESRRQAFHLLLGFLIVALVAFDIIGRKILALALLFGIIISIIQKKKRVPIFGFFLDLFEREKEKKVFPGKGLIFMVGGIFLSLQIFSADIALAASMIMVLGDSVSHFVGRYFGKTGFIFSSSKKIEGTIAGIIAGSAGAMIFVSFVPAVCAAFVAMIFEISLPKKISVYLDDNLLIPLIAGIILTIFV